MSIKSTIFKWLTGVSIESLKSTDDNLPRMVHNTYSSLYDNYLFDFRQTYTGGIVQNTGTLEYFDGEEEPPVQKINIKPIDVLSELETVPTPFNLEMLGEKISVLKDKIEIIKQEYTKREVEALIERLENRKKYLEHKTFFDNFQNTTDKNIDELLKKYNLVLNTSDIFIPEFPTEAISVMKEYTEIMKKVCEKKPIFYVIASADMFNKTYEKRDPILLVQSPFGFYWQILGAWDKEMLILNEL
jgi:hypothetical protein